MTQVREIEFEGLSAVELTTETVRLVAVRQFGPRVASLSLIDGENIFLWKPGEYGYEGWDLRGGHRVWWACPGADESMDTYTHDNEPCELDLFEDGFRLTGARGANFTKRGFEIRANADGTLNVDNFLINDSEMLYAGGLWALTCSVPTEGTRYVVPLGDDSEWDAISLVAFRKWAGHGDGGFADRQFAFTDDTLIIEPRGSENKRMVEAHKGIMAMSDPNRDLTFAKKMTYDPAGSYPLNTNFAFYIGPDNFMVEMETMAAQKTLKPGDCAHHVETWLLKQGAIATDSAEPAKALFG